MTNEEIQLTNQKKQEIAFTHISFSRMNLLKSSKKGFEDRYFLGIEYVSVAMERGKIQDDLIQYADFKNMTPTEKQIAEQMPSPLDHEYISNHKFDTLLNIDGTEYKIVGEADYISTDGTWLGERKNTTANNRTMLKSAEKQLTWYSYLNYLETNEIITNGTIYIAVKDKETKEDTGEVEIHKIVLDKQNILNCERKVRAFVNRIKHLYPV